MNQLIQSLENRVLMSVTSAQLTTDVKTIQTDSTATRVDLSVLHSGDVSFRKSLSHAVNLVNTKTTKAANNKLLATLAHVANTGYSKIVSADNGLLSATKAVSTAAVADGKRLLAHPTKAAYLAKVNADVIRLNALSSRLTVLENAVLNSATLTSPVYADIIADIPAVASIVESAEVTGEANTTAFSNAALQVSTDTTALATDLANPFASAVLFTGATLFRGDSTGANQLTSGGVVTRGGWTSGLDVQNVPGNYAAELFISKVANPTASDFLTPGTLAQSLSTGVNTFYFFADGDDTAGGSESFGLNLFFNGSTLPGVSGYTIPGAGQTLVADSAATTSAVSLAVVPGAGTLSANEGSSATLSSFVVEGVSGQGSTVDLVNSTNTQPFTAPAHADGVADTYGVFTITVT